VVKKWLGANFFRFSCPRAIKKPPSSLGKEEEEKRFLKKVKTSRKIESGISRRKSLQL
jgi:hypothetical protein